MALRYRNGLSIFLMTDKQLSSRRRNPHTVSRRAGDPPCDIRNDSMLSRHDRLEPTFSMNDFDGAGDHSRISGARGFEPD